MLLSLLSYFPNVYHHYPPGVDVDLGASALNIVSKSNPLIQLAEDFELKTASLEGLQFIVPWQGKVFSNGADISEITRDAAQVSGCPR